MKSLIGKTYVPRDNSYAENLTTGEKKYLAGTRWQAAIPVTILTDPYEETITNIANKKVLHTFIKVKCPDNQEHRVLFHEHGIVTESNSVEKILIEDNLFNNSFY